MSKRGVGAVELPLPEAVRLDHGSLREFRGKDSGLSQNQAMECPTEPIDNQ
jgi:hypothetical protein